MVRLVQEARGAAPGDPDLAAPLREITGWRPEDLLRAWAHRVLALAS